GAGESHRFVAAGRPYAYLVPSAAIFALDAPSAAVLDALEERPRTRDELIGELSTRFETSIVDETLAELARVRAVRDVQIAPAPMPKFIPLEPFPLTTMVLNVTNQCNLSCAYCYEYSEDKIVDTANGKKPKFMSEETARESVEFMLRE